jgi:hypothetical protein
MIEKACRGMAGTRVSKPYQKGNRYFVVWAHGAKCGEGTYNTFIDLV